MDFYSILLDKNLGGSGDTHTNFKLLVSGDLTTLTEEMLDGVTSIGFCCFYDCTSLTSVEIPSSVISINSYAFRYCSSLTSVTIPNSVTSIENLAFADCPLASITIPSSVTNIGSEAFRFCTSLASVTVLATTPPTLGTGVFSNTHSSLKIYVPSGSVNAYKAATNWSNYASKIQAIPS